MLKWAQKPADFSDPVINLQCLKHTTLLATLLTSYCQFCIWPLIATTISIKLMKAILIWILQQR